jgi:hypothetical protein
MDTDSEGDGESAGSGFIGIVFGLVFVIGFVYAPIIGIILIGGMILGAVISSASPRDLDDQ